MSAQRTDRELNATTITAGRNLCCGYKIFTKRVIWHTNKTKSALSTMSNKRI